MKPVITVLSALLLLCSCEKENLSVTYIDEEVYSMSHDMIVLGDRLKDPYSVDNVNAALKSLYPTRSMPVGVAPTDYYVRFLPANQDEYDRLEDMGVEMIDHPLDYQILKDGDYYHDPDIPEDEITWQYAVVDPLFRCPARIRYEVLDKCYIPDHDADTRAADIDWAEVEREAYRISGNGDMLDVVSRGDGGAMPSGRISIVDDRKGEPVGVTGVKVLVNSFVKFAGAYTDEEGYYSISRNFSSKVRYRLVFKNKKGFGIGLNLLLVPASTSALGKDSPEGLDVVIDRDSDAKLFSRCAVNNALWDYYSYCNDPEHPMTAPPEGLRIWLLQKMRPSCSPMLHQGAGLDTELVKKYLGEYRKIVRLFLPDMLLGMKDLGDYSSIYMMAVHEAAHASHYMQVGNDYWLKYIGYMLKSFISSGGQMYGNGKQQDSGYCAVGEMWAYYVESVFSRDRYAEPSPGDSYSYWFTNGFLKALDERGIDRGRLAKAFQNDVTTVPDLVAKLEELYPGQQGLIEEMYYTYCEGLY